MKKPDLYHELRANAGFPIPHQVLATLLRDYKNPNVKIRNLIQEGILLPIKKGLYVVGPKLHAGTASPYLIANSLYGPSYVSLETALSYHNMIPEKVIEIRSMTTKASRSFDTTDRRFSFTKLPLPYYAYGIEFIALAEKQFALMATKEKALCDRVITASGILFRSRSQALAYLLEDLRIDLSVLQELNTDTMLTWTKHSPKKSTIQMLIKTLQTL